MRPSLQKTSIACLTTFFVQKLFDCSINAIWRSFRFERSPIWELTLAVILTVANQLVCPVTLCHAVILASSVRICGSPNGLSLPGFLRRTRGFFWQILDDPLLLTHGLTLALFIRLASISAGFVELIFRAKRIYCKIEFTLRSQACGDVRDHGFAIRRHTKKRPIWPSRPTASNCARRRIPRLPTAVYGHAHAHFIRNEVVMHQRWPMTPVRGNCCEMIQVCKPWAW